MACPPLPTLIFIILAKPVDVDSIRTSAMSNSGPPETTIDSSQAATRWLGFLGGSQCAEGSDHGCGDCVRRVVRLSLVANVCGVVLKFVVGFLAG
jgi:hypothetical protein